MFSAKRTKTKSSYLVIALIGLLLIVGFYFFRSQQTSAQTDPSLFGVFEGITPCSGTNRPLPQIPADTNCELMIWKLTLSQDTAGNPTTYKLASAYGMAQAGTTGVRGGGTQLNLEGKWAITRATKTKPGAVVYQLNPDNPPESFGFVKMDDNILHLLAQDKSLMVGNAAWSYTLNRTDKRLASTPPAPVTAAPTSPATPPSPATPESSNPGEFQGRTPCADVLMALNNVPAGCQRIKIALTFQQNPKMFELKSVYVGTGDMRYSLTGKWTIISGTKTDPDAIVYQLTPDGSQQPISFLKADDNHLFLLNSDLRLMVGDALGSYTLSRVD
jgi:hypothetical protein